MDEVEQLRERYRKLPDDRLLDIVEGRELGYREVAVRVAREILAEREVPFTPVPFQQLDQAATEFYAGEDAATYLRQQKRLGRNLLVVGFATFVLPFFGFQFSFLNGLDAWAAALVGAALIAAGAYVLSRAERAEEGSGSVEPGVESPHTQAPTSD